MDKGLKDFTYKKANEFASSLVGKLCSQIESLEKDNELSEETKKYLKICKNLRKELIYQEFRSLRDAITFYCEGREYKNYPIYNPTEEV